MFDFLRPLNKHIIYPLYYWKNGDKRLTRLADIEKSQYFSIQQIQALQLNRLQTLIEYAYSNTVYYREVMDQQNLKPKDIRQLKDIEKLPILTKKIIQERMDDMISSKYNRSELIKDSSGGSTGEPTIYYKDLDRHNLRRADQIRHDRWSGWDIGKRKALVWGAQRDLKAVQSVKEHILSRYIERQWELDAFEMSVQEMDKFTTLLEKIQPSMILGYANALFLYAEYLINNKPNHHISLDGIVSSAETLTEQKREIIETAFKCKVLNRYGSREVGLIASECKQQNGLHINAENIYLELVNNKGHAVAEGNGDILVTDFWNFGMPLIRYKLGDVGTVSQNPVCDCGRGLPLLGAVAGRTGDFFVSTSGEKVHGEYFTHLFYEVPHIKQFQMVQESLSLVVFNLVESADCTNRDYLENIINKTKEMLGENIQVDTNFVKEIKPTSTGKLLFTISKVAQ